MRYFSNAIFLAIILAVAIKLFGGSGLNLVEESSASANHSGTAGIQSLSTQELSKILLDGDSKPTFLMVYASWCPYCKRQFPQVESLAQQYHQNVRFISLSIDNDHEALADFLKTRPDSQHFNAYVYDTRNPQDLIRRLQQMGAQFTGGVPFMALFDGHGKLLQQFSGLTETPILKDALENASISTN